MMNYGKWRILACATLITLSLSAPVHAETPLKGGEKIAFLGDSITEGGMGPTGYVTLVIRGLQVNGIKSQAIGAGISGHKSNQMLERLDRDVISKKPDWMTVSCGVNDVWHGANGVPLDRYKENMTKIVDKAQAAGIKVMILTATMISENPKETNNQKLAAYNDFLHELAREKKCLLADLNADMQKGLDEGEKAGLKRGHMLTTDGVHMNGAGNMMMAAGVLKGFGLSEEQINKAKENWLDIPNGITIYTPASMTLRQHQALQKIAQQKGTSVEALLNEALKHDVAEMLKGSSSSKR